eukprot:320812-Alexandrium_andersonii.AAC.1
MLLKICANPLKSVSGAFRPYVNPEGPPESRNTGLRALVWAGADTCSPGHLVKVSQGGAQTPARGGGGH